ncbi:MAG: phospholipase D-like domain-containing protein [Patescibacteria group bacterium]|nr:phospholipase D-like domain-containing protein [Patescibacteria group bacterium]
MLIQDWRQNLKTKQVLRSYARARIYGMILLFILICVGLGIYHSFKPMPDGLDYQSEPYIVNLDDIQFLRDLTFTNTSGTRESKQEIFDTAFNYIDQAEQYILVDMFLLNDFAKQGEPTYRKLSSELVGKLIAKKQSKPDIRIDVIVDPINTVYDGYDAPNLKAMSVAGINVIVTDLKPLRDDNPIFSEPWRLLVSWWGNSTHGWLPQPFATDSAKVSLRSYLDLLNFKANHRKVFLMDNQGELVSIIGSANAHDASSAHANVDVVIKGVFGQEVYKSEAAVANMSRNGLQPLPENLLATKAGANQYAQVSLLTENKIRQEALAMINKTQSGDRLMLAMFYVSDRPIVKAILAAAKRGVNVQLILDPSKDAFGYKKSGIPNRQVASELVRRSNNKIQVRWYKTVAEQFHTKMMITVRQADNVMEMLVGSANLTKRNIGDYNLETDVKISTRQDLALSQEVIGYFDQLWFNNDGNVYTVDYAQYQDDSLIMGWLYRLQEFSGMSSF